jgi:uncharacterized protein (TIGR00369 family)
MNDLDPRMFGDDQPCFGCSPSNPVGLHLQFERDGDNAVTSTFHAKPGWEGAPGVIHGGLQATLADEVGAWTVIATTGNFGFTTSMQLRYVRPARHDQPVHARGELISKTDKTAKVRVRLTQDGKILLSATASYIMPTEAQAEQIMGRPVPKSWLALTREA